MNTCSLHSGPDGAGGGRERPVVECFLGGGAWQFVGNDDNGLSRLLIGRLTGVQKVLCSA